MIKLLSIPFGAFSAFLIRFAINVLQKGDSMDCGTGMNGVGACGNSNIDFVEGLLSLPALFIGVVVVMVALSILLGEITFKRPKKT